LRSPAPEAGVSTNFTIWAIIFSVAAVDVAHYTERILICKPLILKLINQSSRMQKTRFRGFLCEP
ncbi:hypothetical protein, partial [Pseudomonas sp. SDO5591_S426]